MNYPDINKEMIISKQNFSELFKIYNNRNKDAIIIQFKPAFIYYLFENIYLFNGDTNTYYSVKKRSSFISRLFKLFSMLYISLGIFSMLIIILILYRLFIIDKNFFIKETQKYKPIEIK